MYNRRSIRLKGYDYSQPGAYFVTICTFQRKCVLREFLRGEIILSEFGQIVHDEWFKTQKIRTNVHLHRDEFVVMPNHIHGVLWIIDEVGARRRHAPTTKEEFGKPIAGSLPTIIRAYKAAVTRRINKIRLKPGSPFWQRNYYERVVRNQEELDAIREYIRDNPLMWDQDRNNLNHIKSSYRGG
jgi:putative transposase